MTKMIKVLGKEGRITIPFEIRMQKGSLNEPTGDKTFEARMREIAGKVVQYGQV